MQLWCWEDDEPHLPYVKVRVLALFVRHKAGEVATNKNMPPAGVWNNDLHARHDINRAADLSSRIHAGRKQDKNTYVWPSSSNFFLIQDAISCMPSMCCVNSFSDEAHAKMPKKNKCILSDLLGWVFRHCFLSHRGRFLQPIRGHIGVLVHHARHFHSVKSIQSTKTNSMCERRVGLKEIWNTQNTDDLSLLGLRRTGKHKMQSRRQVFVSSMLV